MATVSELLKHAAALDHLDRVELVATLLEQLEPLAHEVSDADARKRLQELRDGTVASLSEQDFWVACGRN